MGMYEIDKSRLDIIMSLSEGVFGLNLGCGNTRFYNKINMDMVRKRKVILPLEILASGSHLPFKTECFDEIILSEVLEHIPEYLVFIVLREIKRVLKNSGRLIMTVPNGGILNKLTDPFWWLGESQPRKLGILDNRHRHYSKKDIEFFADLLSFKIEVLFTSGKLPWGSQSMWLLNYVTRIDLFMKQVKDSFRGSIGNKGAVLFVIMSKGWCSY